MRARAAVKGENVQLIGHFVVLRPRIFERTERQYGSGHELQQELSGKLGLQLKYVVVKPAAGGAVSLDIQVETSFLSRTRSLRVLDKLEEIENGTRFGRRSHIILAGAAEGMVTFAPTDVARRPFHGRGVPFVVAGI